MLDIEEHIWSPMFGIKGNIDLTVEVNVKQDGSTSTLLMPFEIKTGKSTNTASHRAQTSLYNLMMKDRYGVEIKAGMLYYMKVGEMHQIPTLRNELMRLIIQRNRMATYLSSNSKLPDVEKSKSKCENCFALDTCMVYHKATEQGTAESSGLGDIFDKKVGHMTDRHIQFFQKWEKLISQEESDAYSYRKEIWCMMSAEREKAGRCFGQMKIVKTGAENRDESKVHRFVYTLMKASHDMLSLSQLSQETTHLESNHSSLLNSNINVNDPIVISSEAGHYALAIGFVVSITPSSITVAVDRRLHGIPERLSKFDEENNQIFRGLLAHSPRNAAKSLKSNLHHQSETALYRIDKDEMAAGIAAVRGNLISLFISDSTSMDLESLKSLKKRRLIVDLEPPVFNQLSSKDLNDLTVDLNTDQRKAVEKVISGMILF